MRRRRASPSDAGSSGGPYDKKAVSDAEADLAKFEVVLSAIDKAMFAPASAANEYRDLTMGELSQRRGKIVAAQEAAEARWVAASEALEKAV